jgi:3-oxoacyl-[acyl-carrier protein] reductase
LQQKLKISCCSLSHREFQTIESIRLLFRVGEIMAWRESGKGRTMSAIEKGKIAVITGASRGIGRAIAIRFGKDGVAVAVHYARNSEAAESTVNVIQRAGGTAFAIGAELKSAASVVKFFEKLDAELNRRVGNNQFDILVNNAAIAPNSPVEDTTEELFDQVFALNAKVPFFVTQHALQRLRDGGRIINVSSGATRIASPKLAAYAMTKGALDVLSRILAKQLGSRNITVNTLAPGATETDMNAERLADPQFRQFATSVALGRIGQPDDIADVAAFLASNDGRWVTGQYIDATGGAQL